MSRCMGKLYFLYSCTSYSSICYRLSKVLSKPYAQRFSSVILAERKLSITLLIVTAASIVTLLPWAITSCVSLRLGYLRIQLLPFINVTTFILAIYYLNSILNPLIYALRLRQFRRALKGLFCKILHLQDGPYPLTF